MKNAISLLTGIILCSLLFITSCKRSHHCFDHKLYESMKDNYCTTDCPGVTACNDRSYCNVCEANKAGFRLK